MMKEAIYHRAGGSYSYGYDEDTVHIRLRTKRDDIDSVYLIYGDPYKWVKENTNEFSLVVSATPTENEVKSVWNHEEPLEMKKVGSTALYDYWLVPVKHEYRRLRYGFRLHKNENVLYYAEKGFKEALEIEDIGFYFVIPYLNRADVFKAPDWVKDTVWYQIFPERFANGNKDNNPVGTLPWGSEAPTPTNFFGGDFEGVLQNLDYLTTLGITGIYFTPIFKAFSNHKYDTIDYMEIDPQFGTKETFKQLIAACHERGIRVMIDAVFNHSGFYFPAFQDVLEHGEASNYTEWFHIREFPIIQQPLPSYETFAFEKNMPKLNTENEEVRNYLLEVGRYWVREFGIDGWRLDVANEVDHAFWRDFRKAVKDENPECYILGEIWHDSMPWLQGDQFDSVMNYPFTHAALEFFAKGTISATEFAHSLTEVEQMYPANVNEVMFNLLDSHDTARTLTVCNGNKDVYKLLLTLQFSYMGTPCIYYGDEIGMEGMNDPGCRACMEWNPELQDLQLFQHVQKLLTLRKEYNAFGNGGTFTFTNVDDHKNIIQYTKSDASHTIVITLNNSNETQIVSLPPTEKKEMTNLYTSEVLTATTSITLAPYAFSILSI